MRALDRKLLRDLGRMRGQVLSIALVVACGIAAAVGMGSTLLTILGARDRYYAQARFAHVFASLERAPESMADRIRAIPGVAAVETRVDVNALLTVPGLDEPATAYILSVPAEADAKVNLLDVRRGRAPRPGVPDEVVIGEHFADANALSPGDTLGAVINQRWRRLHVVGVAISPEFIHDVAPGLGQFGDSRHYGILWMSRDVLAPLYGMEGAFDNVAIALAPGASEPAVIARLDALLRPYGGGGAYGRKDQPSDQVVNGELRQLRAFGLVMPAVFLLVAAFLVNIVLSRLVATQREELAVLKAFGYDNRTLGRHFAGYAIAAVAAGAALGVPLGTWVGHRFTQLYVPFFRFPELEHHTSVLLLALTIGISAVAAVLGALGAVRAAIALPPAEGMRPPSPPVYRPLLLERLGIGGGLPPAVRMILRTLERRPWRTLASSLGVALSAAVLVGGLFAFDVVQYLIRLQFGVVERQDVTVVFGGPRPARAGEELAAIPGVRTVEPYRTVAVRLRRGHRARRIAITGLDRDARLRRLVDIDGRVHPVPVDGLVLTASLARTLGIARGDTVSLEVLERGGAGRQVVVAALMEELVGVAGYMSRDAINRLVGEGSTISGAWLALEPGAEAGVLDALRGLPRVAGASTRRATAESFREAIADTITVTTTLVALIAGVIAVGVLYNGARIALSERGRELASLRVLGFTRREVATLLLGEQAAVGVFGTPIGLGLGIGLAWLIAIGFDSELYRFPVIITLRTYLLAVGVVVAASAVAAVAMRRRIDALNMIEVLKTRE